MTRLDFECRFESDIVLHASSNTEGKIEKLDYIPGSNFLGMVAREYSSFGEGAFDLFHSGKVRFGDAHVVVDGKSTFHVPFSFQAPKGTKLKQAIVSQKLILHHFYDYNDSANRTTQIQQLRQGFINEDGTVANLEHNYAQKSAYNKKKRRSEDGTMFGYYALPAETLWRFSVKFDDMSSHVEKIIELLESSKRLGKSKSSQYGRVNIKHIKTVEDADGLQGIFESVDGYLYLYANSRLALTDANGINSYIPDLASFGFQDSDDVSIDWEKSQIRTGRYTPYVGARQNFDPERLVIGKGSVFAIKVKGKFDKLHLQNSIKKGIGLYLSEGHGEIIVNPPWLLGSGAIFANHNNTSMQPPMVTGSDNDLNSWLTQQREAKQQEAALLSDVLEFITLNNVAKKKSQWGKIRSLCSQSQDSNALYDNLFNEDTTKPIGLGFLRHGKALDKWKKSGKLITNLENKKNQCDENGMDYRKFVKLLSIFAPKQDDEREENNVES